MEGKTWVTYFKKDFNCVGLYYIKCCEICVILCVSGSKVFSLFTNSFLLMILAPTDSKYKVKEKL